MTLVFDEPREGPATHALIIGVESPSPAESGPFSAAVTAHAIADLLLGLDFPDAPLASIDLIASYSPFTEANFQNRLTGINYRAEPPDTGIAARAVEAWRGRLDSNPAGLSIFYYAGPVASARGSVLVIPGERPGISGIDFENLFQGMTALHSRSRQLYFVDACPSGAALPAGSVAGLLESGGEALTESVVARFRADFPLMPAQTQQGSWPTILSGALAKVLDGERALRGDDLGAELSAAYQRHADEAGFPELPPLGWAADGAFRLRFAPRQAGGGDGAHSLIDVSKPGAEVSGPKPPPPPPPPPPPSPKTKTPRKAKAKAKAAPPAPAPPPPADEALTDFVLDDAEVERDELGRSVLAIGLARHLHKIWRSTNREGSVGGGRAAFVVHLDAPWGGGKTTFANFLARVLNPCPRGARPASFLRQRFPAGDLDGVFLDDPLDPNAADGGAARLEALKAIPREGRQPWIVVQFNAWQAEHCSPPWWTFYQAIRKGCFDSVLRQGDTVWTPRLPLPADAPWHRRLGRRLVRFGDRAAARAGGLIDWLLLWGAEYGWRLFNPKIRVLLGTALFSVALLWLLAATGIWGIIQGRDGASAGLILANPIGLALTGLGSVTGLWALGALFTESIVPGTDTLSERLSLGNGDPFERFRTHFAATIARVRRPVMVIIDDLDRCRPDFVVDLVRGVQTLLRSPRLVFVILGDRDWIERAFEAHHEKMSKIDVGPEQSFGARFVEKAIQMSFILPALGEANRLDYVRRVLLGERAGGAEARPGEDEAQRAERGQAEARLRALVNEKAAAPEAGPFESKPIVDEVNIELFSLPIFPGEEGGGRTVGQVLQEAGLLGEGQLGQLVNESLAIRAASDDKAESRVVHELQKFAGCFPANPRQIKRIVNAITIYHAVALQRPGVKADDPGFRAQLAMWVIVMTEWPETWRLLASFPDLADLVAVPRPGAALRRKGLTLPGSPAATAKALERIRADRELMMLIGGGEDRAPLQTRYVRTLAELTPLHSRKRRLAEPESPPQPRRKTRRKAKASAAPGAAAQP